MTTSEIINTTIAVVGLLFTAGGLLVAGTLGVSKLRTIIAEENAKLREAFSAEIKQHRREVDEELDQHRVSVSDEIRTIERNFATTVDALKEHVRLFELWARDNLIRRDSFKDILQELRAEARDWRTNIQDSVRRIENLLQQRSTDG